MRRSELIALILTGIVAASAVALGSYVPEIRPIEVVWTAWLALGVFYSVSEVASTRRDQRALVKVGRNGAASVMARLFIFIAVTLLIIQLLFLIVGIGALFQPDASADDDPVSAFDVVLLTALFVGGLSTTLLSLGLRYFRRQLDLFSSPMNDPQAVTDKEGEVA